MSALLVIVLVPKILQFAVSDPPFPGVGGGGLMLDLSPQPDWPDILLDFPKPHEIKKTSGVGGGSMILTRSDTVESNPRSFNLDFISFFSARTVERSDKAI